MNCQNFLEHAPELARARVMDAELRAAALVHAADCATCAARLEHERALDAALRATAESFDELSAPPRVEAALLAAFRASRPAVSAAADVRSAAPLSILASARVSRSRRWTGGALAASAIAASLILAFVVARRPQPAVAPVTSSQLSSNQLPSVPETKTAESPAPARVQPGEVRPTRDESVRARGGGGAARDGGRRPVRVERAAGGQSLKKTPTQVAYAFEIDGGRAVFVEGENTSSSEAAGESASGDAGALTDFVSLPAGAGSAPMDGGQVVRVEAPRAALASLGFPVDARRAGETVRADLLLAHDGTARAIRLVR